MGEFAVDGLEGGGDFVLLGDVWNGHLKASKGVAIQRRYGYSLPVVPET